MVILWTLLAAVALLLLIFSRPFTNAMFVVIASLRSSRFLSFFSGAEIEQANEKRASEGARLGWAKKWGRSREGVSKKGEGVERNRLPLIPNILPNSVRPQTGSNSVIWQIKLLVSSPYYQTVTWKIWHWYISDIQNTRNKIKNMAVSMGAFEFIFRKLWKIFWKTINRSISNRSKELP